jgi:hypothetical protein
MIVESSSIIQLNSNTLPLEDQVADAYLHLKEVFRKVVLFGGCLREQYIRENTPYRAPTNDIDVRVSYPRHKIDASLERYLNALPLDQKIFLPPLQKHISSAWIGLDIIRVTNRIGSWLLETSGSNGQYPIEISLLKAAIDRERLDLSLLKNLRVPFSSIAYGEHGIFCHRDFPRDTQEMKFSILRKDGLRPVLWELPYYHKIKEKYPKLKLQNPEMPALITAYNIKSFFGGNREVKLAHTTSIDIPKRNMDYFS